MIAKPIIVANWKMNGSLALLNAFHSLFTHPHHWIFAPPAVYLPSLTSPELSSISLAGQDCSTNANGAFTGDISAAQYHDIGARYIIVGHSERRQYHQETDITVRQKAIQAHDLGLTPIICIGETRSIYESKNTLPHIKQQLDIIEPEAIESAIIAYEPIWAIGTGLTPTADEIETVHRAIHAQCPTSRVLYGGSVTHTNIEEILAIPFVDGVLVGGASLKPDALRIILDKAHGINTSFKSI